MGKLVDTQYSILTHKPPTLTQMAGSGHAPPAAFRDENWAGGEGEREHQRKRESARDRQEVMSLGDERLRAQVAGGGGGGGRARSRSLCVSFGRYPLSLKLT